LYTTPALLIDVPTKIWRPKPTNECYIPDYRDDIDEHILLLREHGKILAHTPEIKHLPPIYDTEFWDS
jgi:hypothetical protein